jgi:hypothetical protein
LHDPGALDLHLLAQRIAVVDLEADQFLVGIQRIEGWIIAFGAQLQFGDGLSLRTDQACGDKGGGCGESCDCLHG